MNKKNSSHDESLEFAYGPVPKNKRLKFWALFIVLAGYPIALSNFVIGGIIGGANSYTNAVISIIAGNLILVSVVIVMGVLASKTGLSSSYLAKQALGKTGSKIFSLTILMSCLVWMGVNGDLFATLVTSLFDWWPIPAWLTSILVIFMWLSSAINGRKGLAILATLGVPVSLTCAMIGVVYIGSSGEGFTGLFSHFPVDQMGITTSISTIVGGWIVGATISSDMTRFAKRPLHVFIGGIAAFCVGGLGFQLVGATVSASTGHVDFVNAMIASGLGYVALVLAVFCLWTTQDKDIYAGSLSIQNIIKGSSLSGVLKHRHSSALFAVIAAALAAGGIFSYILPIIKILSVLIPSIVGIIVVEGYLIKKSKEDRPFNKLAIISWCAGGGVGAYALQNEILIPPLVAFFVTATIYFALEKGWGAVGFKRRRELAVSKASR